MKHLGLALVAANIVFAALLVANALFNWPSGIERYSLLAAHIGAFAAAGFIFYLIFKTYRVFRENDILLGLVGFSIVFIGYIIFSPIELAGTVFGAQVVDETTSAQLELTVNTIILCGYMMITIAVGWLKR